MSSAAMLETVLKIGEVISVDGRSVRVKVDRSKNLSHLIFQGKALKNVSVGGYLKITKGFEVLIGKIEGEFSEPNKDFSKGYGDAKDFFVRTLKLSLVGYYESEKFKKGIKELPLVGSFCYLLSEEELEDIHRFKESGRTAINVGTLSNDKAMDIELSVDSLFASHIGIFGNTGGGKSYTLTKLYNALFEQYKDKDAFTKNAKFFLIDFNGEYARRDKKSEDQDDTIVGHDYKNVYRLSTKQDGDLYPLHSSVLSDIGFWSVIMEATDKTQVPFIRRALESGYIKDAVLSSGKLKSFVIRFVLDVTSSKDKTLDKTLVLSFLRELLEVTGDASGLAKPISILDKRLEYNNKMGSFYLNTDNDGQVYSSDNKFKIYIEKSVKDVEFKDVLNDPISTVRLKLVLAYFSEILRGFSNREHLAPLIKRLSRRFNDLSKVITITDAKTSDAGRFLTVVSFKDVNIHMRKILPLIFVKHLYEGHRDKSEKGSYLNLIIDEAHNVISPSSVRESSEWKDYRLETFEEIIKEGRKFGVFLTIASQRPFDISGTVISQLHNYFIHRLVSHKDIEAIERNLSYLDKVSIDSLPILPTGTCIVAGLIAQLPVVVDIGRIPVVNEPYSETIKLTDIWDNVSIKKKKSRSR